MSGPSPSTNLQLEALPVENSSRILRTLKLLHHDYLVIGGRGNQVCLGYFQLYFHQET